MKQKYRQKSLDELLAKLRNKNYDEREYTLFQLALILDRSNKIKNKDSFPEYYIENLPRELLRMRLTFSEQDELAKHLLRLILSGGDSRSTAIWTLGKVKGDIGLPMLLDLLQALGDRLDNEAAHQLCHALNHWLESDIGFAELARTRVDMHRVLRVLEKWRSSGDQHLGKLSGLAGDLLEKRRDESRL